MRTNDLILGQRCKRLIRQVTGSNSIRTIDELVQQFSERNGRSITLIPVQTPAATPCGLWISTQHEDRIYYEERTSPLHRHQIIGHELGHLAFNHQSNNQSAIDLHAAQLLMPNLDPELIRQMFGRTYFDAPQEREAEAFAAVAIKMIARNSNTPRNKDCATERFTQAVEGGF
ncbi:Zn-dependent peptidase ImmA (M78 family) [Nocardiopsis mwathae]|uniref:Zn-dependent peptidase ImmA (M78 family) n=1 Tax=Nocardiopsis mwathae TaxID=1472723 RepID=A0A7W9YIQ9_9ACTN|nr:ImmA/IrrE family metallo-endopeptidase [Nocardiopsis mwathae]MBB6172261.1 Zn-dependent peptidase ImmA (M78 family) [Nocardiopsis mwathae]